MSHKTALNKDRRHSLIKSSKSSTRKKQILTDDANSDNYNIARAVRVIKNSIDFIGSTESRLSFQIGEDDFLHQIIDLKGTWFQPI